MILTASEIQKCVASGEIAIDPFIPSHLGPNSYDVRLASDLCRVFPSYGRGSMGELTVEPLDVMKPYETEKFTIPGTGTILMPGQLYLGSTIERTHSPNHVPMYEGRSTMARYGIVSHLSAGFGDLGFNGNWTLEITVTLPTRLYPGMRIGQVYFLEVQGQIDRRYGGRYSYQSQAAVGVAGNI